MSAEPTRAPVRIRGLDALRGLAAASVVLYHFTHTYGEWVGHRQKPLVDVSWGIYGVHLFFLISGFVIFMTVDKSRSAGEFIRSRFARLYPAYWAAVCLTFAVTSLFPLPGMERTFVARAIANLTMVQAWVGIGDLDQVYWTLHVELTFYAIMVLLMRARWLERTEWVLGAFIVAGFGFWFAFGWHAPRALDLVRTILAVDHLYAFAIGVCLYRMKAGVRPVHGALIALALAFCWVRWSWYESLIVAGLAVVVFLATRGRLRVLEARPLLFLGTISYSLYLCHNKLGSTLIHQLEARGVDVNVAICAAIVATFAVSCLVHYTVEAPALAYLRDKLRVGRHVARDLRSPAHDAGAAASHAVSAVPGEHVG
jgi:peptidoglycan/LPS O-acetylase OafA/YrhL